MDADGHPSLNVDGYSRVSYRYDDRGNQLEAAYFGVEGRPVATKEGYSRRVSEYSDGRDNETAVAYFGTNGKPITIANTENNEAGESVRNLNYARLQRRYNENGRIIDEAYFDADGKPMIGPDRYASWRAIYDSTGNRIEVGYFGLRGERVTSAGSFAGWRASFDTYGRQIKLEHFGVRSEPTTHEEGIAGWTTKYNAQGREAERVYFDVDGGVAVHSQGYAGFRTQYDSCGDVVEYVYLGRDMNRTLRPWNSSRPADGGYAKQVLRRDARGRVLESAYFGIKDEGIVGPAGWARVVNRYDSRATMPIGFEYFDAADTPATLDDGYHSLRQRLDIFGRVVETSHHNAQGAMVLSRNGYARRTYALDLHGRMVEQRFFAQDGSPLMSTVTFHRFTNVFDERGLLMEVRFFGTKGEPVPFNGNAQHLKRRSYDERGLLIEVAHFDTFERPTLGYDYITDQSCARWTARYDEEGKLIKASQKCETNVARLAPSRVSGTR